jgi:acetoin utilization protein AcuB
MPSSFASECDLPTETEKIKTIKVRDIMTKDPVTVNPTHTLQDAILLLEQYKVGALPVVDENRKVIGILSVRDLLRAFINVLGIGQPGVLLGIVAEDKLGQTKNIVDAISEENIPFGSILVARHWEEGKRAVFPYLLTNTVGPLKKKLVHLGYEILDPLEWTLESGKRNV